MDDAWDLSLVDTYRALVQSRSVAEDSVHEMIHRFGPRILRRDFPYLVTVAKGLGQSADRTAQRRQDILARHGARPRSSLDPLEAVVENAALRETLEALAKLPDDDALLLWWHALGFSDEEIMKMWSDAGQTGLSEVAIRQRRSRSRRALKLLVKDREHGRG